MASFDNLELAQGRTCPVSEPAVEVHLVGVMYRDDSSIFGQQFDVALPRVLDGGAAVVHDLAAGREP